MPRNECGAALQPGIYCTRPAGHQGAHWSRQWRDVAGLQVGGESPASGLRILPADHGDAETQAQAITADPLIAGVRFVAVGRAVMQAGEAKGVMCSKTFAKRTARALNNHVPNSEGV